MQAIYDQLSQEGKILFDISFGQLDDPNEWMSAEEIRKEIAYRRGYKDRS